MQCCTWGAVPGGGVTCCCVCVAVCCWSCQLFDRRPWWRRLWCAIGGPGDSAGQLLATADILPSGVPLRPLTPYPAGVHYHIVTGSSVYAQRSVIVTVSRKPLLRSVFHRYPSWVPHWPLVATFGVTSPRQRAAASIWFSRSLSPLQTTPCYLQPRWTPTWICPPWTRTHFTRRPFLNFTGDTRHTWGNPTSASMSSISDCNSAQRWVNNLLWNLS